MGVINTCAKEEVGIPERQVKQVIVIRKDLKMRRGKEIAQGAHASMGFLTQRIKDQGRNFVFTDPERAWIFGIFTKACVQVESEEELVKIHLNANLKGVYSHLIIDKGLTEFGGVPTTTCCAVGPDYSDLVDKITGHLKLY